MSALKTLVLAKIKEKAIYRNEVVKAIGYKNLTKGLRKLDNFAETGNGAQQFIEKLLRVLEISPEEYAKAITVDSEEQERRDREAFRPFIEMIIERGTMPIFILAIIHSHGIIPIEKMTDSICEKEEIASVFALFEKRLRSSEALSAAQIKGFKYYRTFDECWFFDEKGNRTEIQNQHVSPDKVELRVGSKKIPISSFFGQVQHERGSHE